jgi:hypothetical protein
VVTFDGDAVRSNPALEGELRGPVSGAVYRAEDVTLMGPNDGAEAMGSFAFEEIDLTEGPSGPHVLDFELPAGEYQFLGFMDTDGNADETGGPDLNDPVIFPVRATTLACAEQPVTVSFPLLLPDL